MNSRGLRKTGATLRPSELLKFSPQELSAANLAMMRISKAALVVVLFEAAQGFVVPSYAKKFKRFSTTDDVSSEWRRPDLFGTSLVDDTKRTMEEFTTVSPKEERALRRRALDKLGIPSFKSFLQEKDLEVRRSEPQILQVNIGLYCNQACSHCHVESSPLRTEHMESETASQILKVLQNTPSIKTLDITGGAPEANPNFRYLVSMARALCPDLEIIDRCNLTVLQEPGQEDLVDFLTTHRVRVVASLPCYSKDNVDQQRGNGVFERSIAALLMLNEAGYGTTLPLDLVYNPGGAFLPPSQETLEAAYKKELRDKFGIVFTSLFTMTNMPVKRFADYLHRNKQLVEYMQLLIDNFNPSTIDSLMCKDTISIDYDGRIFDCDFNQQLGISTNESVFDVDSFALSAPIQTDNHCFGCTAGLGSS